MNNVLKITCDCVIIILSKMVCKIRFNEREMGIYLEYSQLPYLVEVLVQA